MRDTLDRTIYWLPRALAILFAIFLSFFALEAIRPGYDPGLFVLSLLIHLIPTAVVLILLAVAWRWEGIGGVAFIVLALLFIFSGWGQFQWTAYALISGPLLVVGVLFMIGWWRNRESVR
jgi:hypothetical protein